MYRDQLPFFRDPTIKFSVWTILKDCIGKDITKISMPVYFNEPLSVLQKMAQSAEYNHILDLAVEEPNSVRRTALLAIHGISSASHLERTTNKPFNALLGETFELCTDEYKFFAEQVCHHPPVTAIHT